MSYQVIFAALKPDVTDAVIDAAKECGISGATIVSGRGTGLHEAKTFLGLTLETQYDLLLFLTETELVDPVLAAIIGFSTTLAEPALIAVAFKAEEASRGTIRPWSLRLVVAAGVAAGISLGAFRIVTGESLVLFIAIGYLLVVVQTAFAPKTIIPLAYDSGGVTTSTVTVPLVAALGLGLSATIPGRNPALDGFGLIAFASLFPMITVMGYAQLAGWRTRRRLGHSQKRTDP